MKYMVTNGDGTPSAFYADDVHGPRLIDGEPNPDTLVPPEAVEISDDVWQTFLNNQGCSRWADDAVEMFEPDPPTPPAVALCQVAGARLMVDQDNWDVTGVERSTGISGAWLDDDDVVVVLFDTPQPDTLYEVVPNVGVTKFPEYVVVTRPALAELNFIVQRVQ